MNIPYITECFSLSSVTYPIQEWIWIPTTILILFRRLQWRIAVVLVEGEQRVSPFYRDFLLLLPKWSACVQVIETRVSLPESEQRCVSFLSSINSSSFSFEKTKLCHRPILSSDAWLVSRQTTGFSVLSWSGIGFGWLDWELLDCWATSPSGCRTTSEPNSFIQSCFKEIFGGGRDDGHILSRLRLLQCPSE